MAFDAIAELRGRAPERDEMIAIGDGIRTDIAGAAAVGIRSVFIASAVHVKAPLTPALLDELFPAGGATPIAALAALA
jgi:ribonucleotide monophosphatase NagD (HAD superfamily)